MGVAVVALSADGEAEARQTAEKHKLPFPVGYGLDVQEMLYKLGGYGEVVPPPGYQEKSPNGFLHATAFILQAGRVAHATYSSGPLGRLEAKHAVQWITFKQGS